MLKNNSLERPSPDFLAGLLGADVSSVEPLEGGRNSRTFEATTDDGSKYVAKLYLDTTADGESRAATEFTTLEFLHSKGIRCVPRPVAVDHDRQCAIYELIEGTKVDSSHATVADIDQMCRFLLRLKELKADPDSIGLPNAAEACFSIQSIIRNLESRLDSLQKVDDSSPQAGVLQGFLDKDFLPLFKETVAWCQKRIDNAGGSMASELDHDERTLSPSDFGFHNCLRRTNGELVFLDFEYFGWDDPAKMISDFLLHPAMDLSRSLKQRFVDKILGTKKQDQALLDRTETVYPLFGLKWCMILLNPFLSQYRLHRGLVGESSLVRDGLLEQQLEKARLMLNLVETECMHFPYKNGQYAIRVT